MHYLAVWRMYPSTIRVPRANIKLGKEEELDKNKRKKEYIQGLPLWICGSVAGEIGVSLGSFLRLGLLSVPTLCELVRLDLNDDVTTDEFVVWIAF